MEINRLTKSFAEKKVFDNFNVKFTEGKVSFVMGESGCGKTTLLKIIAGLDSSFTGKIKNNFKKISYVFQEPRLFPSLTVRKNLELVENNSSLSIDEVLKILELYGEGNSYPDSLSGGMKMRLSIARALLYNGDLFLMDEPFSALDENTKSRIIPRFFSLTKDKTVIIVSHDLKDAQAYADEIINLDKQKTLT